MDDTKLTMQQRVCLELERAGHKPKAMCAALGVTQARVQVIRESLRTLGYDIKQWRRSWRSDRDDSIKRGDVEDNAESVFPFNHGLVDKKCPCGLRLTVAQAAPGGTQHCERCPELEYWKRTGNGAIMTATGGATGGRAGRAANGLSTDTGMCSEVVYTNSGFPRRT